jgi:hypothetical protein
MDCYCYCNIILFTELSIIEWLIVTLLFLLLLALALGPVSISILPGSQKIMWHNKPYWDDASAKKDACDA